jgi:hypothetical protein
MLLGVPDPGECGDPVTWGSTEGLTDRQLSVAAGLLERMSVARHLAVVERLCGLDLPREGPDRGTALGRCGPGWQVAELRRSGDVLEDPSLGEEVAEQFECDREALAERLRERWGEPQRMGLLGAFVRSMEGEEIPEPWGWLCQDLPDVHLWRADDRWLALGVSHHDRELPYALLAVVTFEDPP